jgi:hypothetical protein
MDSVPPDVVTPTAPSGALNRERTYTVLVITLKIMCTEMPYHSYDFGLHFAYSREDVRVDWIRHSELAESLRLKAYQLLTTVIYRSTDPAVLPPGVFHVGQLSQLLAYILFAPSRGR